MNETLKVKIEADISNLQSQLKAAEAAVASFEGKAKKIGQAIDKNNNAYSQGSKSTADFAAQNKVLSQRIDELVKTTASYDAQIKGLKEEIDRLRTSNNTFVDSANKVDTAIDGSGRSAKVFSTELTGVAAEINRVQNELRESITITRGYDKAQQELNNEFKAGTITQKQYQAGLNRLQRDEKESQVVVSNLRKELALLKRDQRDLGTGINTTAGAVKNLGNATRTNAVPAMTSFSQVVQDAPYGIQGVANNIQQLTMQFGYLSKQAGGTKGALKAMVGSLVGPGGILLAVSVVTTLLITFGDKLFSSGEAAKTAAEKLQEYADSLKGIEKAQLEASISAAKELTQLRLLSQQATNTALATNERMAAVKALRDLYPTYLKGMTDEQILANGLTTAYNEVTNSIMRKARAQAASNIMVDNLEEEFKLRNKLSSIESKIAAQRETVAKSEKTALDAISQNLQGQETLQARANKERSKLNEILEEQLDLQGQIQSKELQNIDLTESVKASGDLIVTPENITVAGESKDGVRIPLIPVMGDLNMSGATNGMIEWKRVLEDQLKGLKEVQAQLPQFSQAYRDVGEDIASVEDRLKGMTDTLAESGRRGAESFAMLAESAGLESFNEKLAETNEFANMFASSVGGAISEMGNNISKNLSESGDMFAKFGAIIINTGIQMLAQMVQMAIKNIAIKKAEATAGGIKAATETASATGPAAAFVLPGLIAGMVGLIASSFPKFATGGVVGGNSYTGDKIMARLNSGEVVLNRTQQQAALSLMSAPPGMGQGASGQLEIVGHTRIDGNDLIVTYRRAEQRNNRIS